MILKSHLLVRNPETLHDSQSILSTSAQALIGRPHPAESALIRVALRDSTAHKLMSTWADVRSVEALLQEISEAFNGIDPLRPVFRGKLEGAKSDLLEIRDHLYLGLEVELREPLSEEILEMRAWLEELQATS